MRVVSDQPYQETRLMKNRFYPEKFYDHTIVTEGGDVVCHLRIKPSSVLWKQKHAKRWRGVTLTTFEQFMSEKGIEQKK